MTQQNTGMEKILRVNPIGSGFGSAHLCLSVRVCFLYRMRCADISAERNADGQWSTAKADFRGGVTGTVRLVRTGTKICPLC